METKTMTSQALKAYQTQRTHTSIGSYGAHCKSAHGRAIDRIAMTYTMRIDTWCKAWDDMASTAHMTQRLHDCILSDIRHGIITPSIWRVEYLLKRKWEKVLRDIKAEQSRGKNRKGRHKPTSRIMHYVAVTPRHEEPLTQTATAYLTHYIERLTYKTIRRYMAWNGYTDGKSRMGQELYIDRYRYADYIRTYANMERIATETDTQLQTVKVKKNGDIRLEMTDKGKTVMDAYTVDKATHIGGLYEDCVQAVWEALLPYMPYLETWSDINRYRKIAYNAVIHLLDSQKRQVRTQCSLTWSDDTPMEIPDYQIDKLANKIGWAQAWQAVSPLIAQGMVELGHKRYAYLAEQVAMLVGIHQYTVVKCASVLGVSKSSIGRIWSIIRGTDMREYLSRHFDILDMLG